MKPTLMIATLSLVFASPAAIAKSELETLRSLCQEQKRQINELEVANERLRSGSREAHSSQPARTEIPSPAESAAAVAKPNAPAATASTYTVKAGDNFEKIARKVGTNPAKLAKSNGMKTSSIIHPGQKLKVPGSAAPSVPATPGLVAATATSPKNSGKTHKVLAGETFSSISKKHGVSTQDLAAANPKTKATSLRPGQVVSLGGDAPAMTMIHAPARAKTQPTVEQASTPAPVTKSPTARENAQVSSAPRAETQSAPASAKTPAESLSPTTEKKIRPITIEGETTYGEFATKHGTDAERLNALNGLDLTTATVLAKGSELYVPAQP